VLGGLLGAGVVLLMTSILPWALAFAAGAMVYVVIHELLPDAHASGNGDVGKDITFLFFLSSQSLSDIPSPQLPSGLWLALQL